MQAMRAAAARSHGLQSFTFTCMKKGKVNTAAKKRFFHFCPVKEEIKYWASEADYKANKTPKGKIKVVKIEELVDDAMSSNTKKHERDKKKKNTLSTFLGGKHTLQIHDAGGRVYLLSEYQKPDGARLVYQFNHRKHIATSKVQAVLRGRAARTQLKAETSAATKIQAITRGKSARKPKQTAQDDVQIPFEPVSGHVPRKKEPSHLAQEVVAASSSSSSATSVVSEQPQSPASVATELTDQQQDTTKDEDATATEATSTVTASGGNFGKFNADGNLVRSEGRGDSAVEDSLTAPSSCCWGARRAKKPAPPPATVADTGLPGHDAL